MHRRVHRERDGRVQRRASTAQRRAAPAKFAQGGSHALPAFRAARRAAVVSIRGRRCTAALLHPSGGGLPGTHALP